MQLKIKKLNSNAQIPTYAHSTDSGMDLRSTESGVINPGETVIVGTGISIELPLNTEAQIRTRSGMAAKHQVVITNSPGTIDEGYTGEIKLILTNLSQKPFSYAVGDKLAQMVIAPVLRPQIVEVEDLVETARGANGFGSTGI